MSLDSKNVRRQLRERARVQAAEAKRLAVISEDRVGKLYRADIMALVNAIEALTHAIASIDLDLP